MVEIWKDIEGYEGLYRISNHGRVWGCKHKKLLKPILHHSGYLHVSLCRNARSKHFNIHRLVALNFIKLVEGKNCVNHIDEDKTNNCVGNLEWCDHKENNNHGTHNKRMVSSRKTSKAWKSFAESRSIEVIGIHAKTGEKIKFDSMKKADEHGFYNSSISRCIRGKAKIHKGYKWYRA